MNAKCLVLLPILLLAFGLGVGSAAESDDAASPQPALNAAKLPLGWMILLGRFGGGATMSGGAIEFEDVPRGADEQTTFGARYGDLINLGVEALFFPTQGRQFMLSATMQHMYLTTDMNFDDDEYGYEAGLDHRLLRQHMTTACGGIGYRWLYGERNQHASSLYGKFGFGGANMAVDGLTSNSEGGAVVIDLGTNYYYRFDDRMIFGFQFDLRGWGAGYTETEFDALDTTGQFSNGGFTGLISVLIGWETL